MDPMRRLCKMEEPINRICTESTGKMFCLETVLVLLSICQAVLRVPYRTVVGLATSWGQAAHVRRPVTPAVRLLVPAQRLDFGKILQIQINVRTRHGKQTVDLAGGVPTAYVAGMVGFGANTPIGFTQHIKQKPAGQLYVEYDVACVRQGPAEHCWIHMPCITQPIPYSCVAEGVLQRPSPNINGIAAGVTLMLPWTDVMRHCEPKNN